MKKSDLKLYTPFYNSNGYLSIIYKITENKMYILNYNGTLYSLTINNSHNESTITHYKFSDVNSDKFFSEFPKNRLYDEDKEKFNNIKKEYHKSLESGVSYDSDNRVLLLII